MLRASEYHKQGYNCAESMIKAYNEEHNTNIPVSLGSGMGTGLGVGSLCGAVNAAALIVGYLRGREDSNEANEARKIAKELMQEINGKYGTSICKELKQNKVSCAEIIDNSYEALNKVLEIK
ncbi:C-GCAxxG-C-C family (seleno)protein [Clostridium ihumii]|uniref:C-GCAxxG-C-C family (seleno)protein n=1 Tax=Clostridium ihumii TaxID=1470356 RepID=UPI0005913912|nr:C-GCAxxG-C-C family (seleno)protein [Clostridium ihumii]